MNTNLRNDGLRTGGAMTSLGGAGIGVPTKGFGSNTPVRTEALRTEALKTATPPGLSGASRTEGQVVPGIEPQIQKSVVVCDTQPVTAEGVRTLLAGNPDLGFLRMAETLAAALSLVREVSPDVVMVDKAFGIQAVLEWLNEVRLINPNVSIVVWGVSVTEAEALRFLQGGARGILRKTAGVNAVLACLRTVAERRSWMEDAVFRDSGRSDRYPRSELTSREQQVLELVEQGFKNKEIALDLGIRPGTVKIHLKHIFEKTGVRGRYGLALSGLKDREGNGFEAGGKAAGLKPDGA